MNKSRKNKTIQIDENELVQLSESILDSLPSECTVEKITDRLIKGDIFELAPLLPHKWVDLLILDPPYNLDKKFGIINFKKTHWQSYSDYIHKLLNSLIHTLKDTASIYICGDWYSSSSLYSVASEYFNIHNSITWQREKGRGSKINWKNAHEDIWFCTLSKKYTFNAHKVKLRKKVLAPYTYQGKAKDWQESPHGKYRDTYPSNFWNDLTVPYWSMPENTPHPTQKPEKLFAKLILASSHEKETIFDPYMGSGSACVVAKKLKRHFVGIDIDPYYTCLAQKRLNNIKNKDIQGYAHEIFWERNSFYAQKKDIKKE